MEFVMKLDDIRNDLFSMQDIAYRNFQIPLIPTVAPEAMIGVRTPLLRSYAKSMVSAGIADTFLSDLPHKYFEEDQLHAFIISGLKDFDDCVCHLDIFLPYINNWATCDQLSPKAFKRSPRSLLPHIDRWLSTGRIYSIRFGIKALMDLFLDDLFDISYLEKVSAIESDEYYVRMMIAWYFATALAKQYEESIPYLISTRLEKWTHNMTIRKATESRRIPEETKEFLRSLRRN